MASVNRHDILGYVGQQPDIRHTQNNQMVANFSVATTEKYKDKSGNPVENTDWHNVVAWGRLAEIVKDYLTKGSRVYISGKSQTRQWEDKEGIKRYTTEINAREMVILSFDKPDNDRSEPEKQGDTQPDTAVTDAKIIDKFDGEVIDKPTDADGDNLPF